MWRDGQKKKVYVYRRVAGCWPSESVGLRRCCVITHAAPSRFPSGCRFLATGTLEEKVFQRQLSKKGLQTIVVEEGDEVNTLSSDGA